MNRLAVIFCLATLGSLGRAVEFPGAAENMQVDVKGDSVAVTWDAVGGATGYLVKLSSGQEMMARIPTASFGGLTPMTTYTIEVTAEMGNETGEMAEIEFTTRLGKVMGFMVSEATETSISVQWTENNLTDSYVIRVVNQDGEEMDGSMITQQRGSANIGGLQAISFYSIYIRGVSSPGMGEETMIRARTDGSGFKMTGVWEDGRGVVGGSGMIYRPLATPLGVYRIGVKFPCEIESATFWNANEDTQGARPLEGYFELVQDELWMREKTEIGITYYTTNETVCNFVNQSVTVTFDDEVVLARQGDLVLDIDNNTQTIDVELTQYQWANLSMSVNSAGWLRFRLDKIFHGMNSGDDSNTTIPKPAPGSFVITLNPGPDCAAAGLFITHTWGMTLKDTSGMTNVGNVFYFSQLKTEWHVAKPGLVYGYDPEICPDQFNMTASVMIGGVVVESINELPKA